MVARKNIIGFNDWLQTGTIRICRVHFWLIGIYVIYIVASDATQLITRESVKNRWTVATLLLGLTAIVWYASRAAKKNSNYYRLLIYALIVADILFATFNVYTQRGMSARAVLIYGIPIIISAILLSRVAILTTATLAASAYAFAAVKYFTDFFNEGYKAELYIEVGFYIACMYIFANLLNILVRFKNAEKEIGL